MQIPSHNELNKLHWSKRHKMTRQWETWIRYSMRPGGLDCASGKRHVIMMAYRKQRITDVANLIAGANKTLVDALVRCGLLLDDSDKLATFEYHQATCKDSPTKKPWSENAKWKKDKRL